MSTRSKEFIIPETGHVINLQENEVCILGGLANTISYNS